MSFIIHGILYNMTTGRMLTKRKAQAVADHLNNLSKGIIKPKQPTCGIRLELEIVFTIELPSSFIATWPKLDTTNCSEVMPIKDRQGNYFLQDKTGGRKSIWDARTRVGKLRRELCLHIAAEIRKEIKAGVYK